MWNKYKLDSCTKLDSNHFMFIYNGIAGTYDKSELYYNEKLYKFYPRAELDSHMESNFFTEDDIDLLIALRDRLNIEAFPFRKPSGEVTYIFLSEDWLMHQGLAILANSEDSKVFKLEEDKLFVDEKEVNYQKQCTFHNGFTGEFTYGIPFYSRDTKEILLLLPVKVGCRIQYLKDLIPYLPLKEKIGYFKASPFGYKTDCRNGYYYDNKLSKFPVNKVDYFSVATGITSEHIDYMIHSLVKHFTFRGIKGEYTLDKDTDKVTSIKIGNTLLHPDGTSYIAYGRVPIGFIKEVQHIDPRCKSIDYRIKPLERWGEKSEQTYLDSQSFEFDNYIGVIDRNRNGSYSIMWGSYIYNSANVEEELGRELSIAINNFLDRSMNEE